MLATLGFTNVSSMEGGINAWQGLRAAGPPEAGMAHFPEGAPAEELIALAWLLEDGSRRFYSALADSAGDAEARKLFSDLAGAERRHEEALAGLYESVTGKQPGADFPGSLLRGNVSDDVMEGGMSVSEGLSWAAGRSASEVLELAISLETNAYDLYIKLGRKISGGGAPGLFTDLMEEERRHLSRLAGLLERSA